MNTTRPRTMFDALNDFFFREETPYGLALCRIFLPMVILIESLPRFPWARELFSTDGATAPLAFTYSYYDFLPEFSGPVVVALFTLFLFALTTSILGWCSRTSLAICTALHFYFTMTDSVGTMTKYTVISVHGLLLLAVSQSGAVWSIDSWLRQRRNASEKIPYNSAPKFPVWPARLMQLLLGLIYFGAGVTKIHTPTFFSGDQMQLWLMTRLNYSHPVGESLALFPVFLILSAYITVVWEVVFIFVVWRDPLRWMFVAMGVLFHFLTTVLLGLYTFPPIMISLYMSFLTREDLDHVLVSAHRIQKWLKLSWMRTISLPTSWLGQSATGNWVYGCLAVLCIGGGVQTEHWLDLYGERRPEGRYQLPEMDADLVREMLAGKAEVRPEDQFFSIKTGSFLVGDLLADYKQDFKQGEVMIAQCVLVPPHEDLWLECKIYDSDNRIVERIPQVAARESFRSTFSYGLCSETPCGDYTLVFEKAGHEIARRQIRVVPGKCKVQAN